MASLLQQGISAFEKGDTETARKLFEQVLLADDQNDRALVWMSRVARTPAERKSLLERALKANPANADARAALESLAEPTTAIPPAEKPASGGLLKHPGKPFRVEPETDAPAEKPTAEPVELPPEPDDLSVLRQSAAASAPKRPSPKKEPLPLVPAIVIGALSVTALGGLLLLVLVLLLT